MTVMLPIHRNATAGNEKIQVIGLYSPPATSDEGEDQWLAIDSHGLPGYYRFEAVVFDGWLP